MKKTAAYSLRAGVLSAAVPQEKSKTTRIGLDQEFQGDFASAEYIHSSSTASAPVPHCQRRLHRQYPGPPTTKNRMHLFEQMKVART
jgi:hypothetical protein